MCFFFFFFNDTATTEIYTLSLHDALPILLHHLPENHHLLIFGGIHPNEIVAHRPIHPYRSEEHTSELQSRSDLVCRLLLEKKKQSHPTVPSQSSCTHVRVTMSLPS